MSVKELIKTYYSFHLKDNDVQNVSLLLSHLDKARDYSFRKTKQYGFEQYLLTFVVLFIVIILSSIAVLQLFLSIGLKNFVATVISSLLCLAIIVILKEFLLPDCEKAICHIFYKNNYGFLNQYFEFDAKLSERNSYQPYAVVTLYSVLFFLFKMNLLSENIAKKFIAFNFNYIALINDFNSIQNNKKEKHKRKIDFDIQLPEIKRLIEMEINANLKMYNANKIFQENKKLLNEIKSIFDNNQDVIDQKMCDLIYKNINEITNMNLHNINPKLNKKYITIQFITNDYKLKQTKNLLEQTIKNSFALKK